MTSLYQKQDDLQEFLLRAPIQDDDGEIFITCISQNSNKKNPENISICVLNKYQNVILNFFIFYPGLYMLSYKREPPANRFEKQQLKCLKNEAPARRRCQALTI